MRELRGAIAALSSLSSFTDTDDGTDFIFASQEPQKIISRDLKAKHGLFSVHLFVIGIIVIQNNIEHNDPMEFRYFV